MIFASGSDNTIITYQYDAPFQVYGKYERIFECDKCYIYQTRQQLTL